MPSRPPAEQYTVALQGFSEFERGALASFFRLAAQRSPNYVQVDQVDRSDFVIADADQRSTLQSVMSAGRTPDTVFVGAHAPQGANAWLRRPIDPVHIVRELDSLVELRHSSPGGLAADATDSGVDVLLGDTGPSSLWSSSDFGGLEAHHGAPGPDVLVVEDSSIARRFLQVRLQRLGNRVHLAVSGEGALEAIERQRFALVFLDVMLGAPGRLDGLKLCQLIRKDPRFSGGRGPRIIIVTGLAGAMDRVRANLAGCDAYLTKPLVDAEFIETLRTLDPGFAARQPSAAR